VGSHNVGILYYTICVCTYSWSLIAAFAGMCACGGRGIKALAPQKHQLIVHFSDNKHSRRLAKSLLFQAPKPRGIM